MTDERDTILAALDRWTRQRPGLEFGNYGDAHSYRAELRSITRDLTEFRALLRAVRATPGIDAARLRNAFRAYAGRLSWDGERLSYCTGQYWPTEYRRAACAVLAAALWDYTRDNMPKPSAYVVMSYGTWNGDTFGHWQSAPMSALAAHALAKQKGADYYVDARYDGLSAGDWMRRYFRREFGRGIASRWFN